MSWKNKLYFGDNLTILREHIPDECVDLIYLDPPFNSNATYNVLFADKSGQKSAAQIAAFEDTWHWNVEQSEAAYQEVVLTGGKLADLISAMLQFLGRNDMMAYLVMMAVRLKELHRVLKPTGSLYLHCDPTASHYLKLVLDALFDIENYRNEIIWKRKAGRGETNNAAVRFGVSHDVLLFYAKSSRARFIRQYRPNNPEYIASKFVHLDEGGRIYRLDNLTSPSDRPNLKYEYKGYSPPDKGWAVSIERMMQMEAEGRLHFPDDQTKRIQRKRFLDELDGETVDTLWDDIPPINSQAQERLGYPTQKPETLLERIIKASSNEGDIIMDPFCGCGTAIAVAEKLHRKWIGIDVTHLAITLIRHRLHTAFGSQLAPFEIIGAPLDVQGAQALAEQDRYQFQWWALGLVDARPTAGTPRKGADRGIDGFIYFIDDPSGKAKRALIQVKSGGVKRSDIATLKGDMEREKAEIAVFVTLEEPTNPMKDEAAVAGFYEPEYAREQRVPKVQILTIDKLLSGAKVELPRLAPTDTFKKAPKQRKGFEPEQGGLF